MGVGGSFGVTVADTLSGFYNPAGLAYVDSGTIGVAYRNLPSSRTRVSGSRANPNQSTDQFRGNSAISHVGFALPVKSGVFGLSYTVGGYVRDRTAGTVTDGVNTAALESRRTLRTDYYTLAYGQTTRDQTASYGIGVVFARTELDFRETFGNFDSTDTSGSTNGVGVILGAQFVPKGASNTSFGISYRSEIKLNGNNQVESLYRKIPARLAAGLAIRQDGLRGGRDFLVYGLQVQHFFSGDGSSQFDRNAQTVGSAGVEYNFSQGSGRIPVRLGFNLVPAGGDLYGSRNALTFGVGYRPNDGRYGFDVNFATPQRGGYDVGLSFTYRFKN
jgi:hypothetical protein